jgi:cation diffusion facilitator CzcD-associated flavoprotein CzcO
MRDACNVLVIGGGGAGLAAAIEAAGRGAAVILLEKNAALGGTTAWSIGSFTATQTPQQLARGIEDSPDEHFADMPKFAGPLAERDNPALRRLFVDNANETLRWLMAMGIEFFGPMPEPPHSKPRMHNVLPNSRAYIHRLGRRADALGVDIRLGTRAARTFWSRAGGSSVRRARRRTAKPSTSGPARSCWRAGTTPPMPSSRPASSRRRWQRSTR